MSVRGVVALKRGRQAGGNVLGRIVIAAREKTPRHDAKPPRHLLEPGAMLRGKVPPLFRGRLAEERAPLGASGQGLGGAGERPPGGHETADLATPGGT
jgi:hypothetical protein